MGEATTFVDHKPEIRFEESAANGHDSASRWENDGPTRLGRNFLSSRSASHNHEASIQLRLQEQVERKRQSTLTNMHQAFVKSINAYALVLVLLVTITYAGFLQPPGSFDNNGLMRVSSNFSLKLFVFFNSFSFFFSVTDLLLCLSGNFAPLADLHDERYYHPEDIRKRRPNSGNRRATEFLEHMEQATTSMDSIPMEIPPPESVYLEQAITHKLASFVAGKLTKLVYINVMFVISLTCCVAAYVSAGFAVQKTILSDQISILIPSLVGCIFYVGFLIWLLADSVKFLWYAGFQLGALQDSLAAKLAANADHLEVQFKFNTPTTELPPNEILLPPEENEE